jgi:hypothetical protein
LEDSTYYWRVKAKDNSGNESNWSNIDSFLVDTSAPAAPDELSENVNSDNVSFNWNIPSDGEGSGVSFYTFEIDNNVNFSSPLSYNQSDTNRNISALNDGKYYWRVKAVDDYGNASLWSNIESFTIDTTSTLPPDGLNYTRDHRDIYLYWNDSIDAGSGVQKYIMEYYDWRTPGNKVVVESNGDLSEVDLQNITCGYYYWRVKSIDNADNGSSWSTLSSFEVDLVSDSFGSATEIDIGDGYTCDEYVGKLDGYDYYKFELNNAGEFSFALNELDAKTKLCLYEKVGWKYKKVKAVNSRNRETSVTLDDVLLDDGIYYLEIISGDKGKGKFNTDYTLEITPDYFPPATDDNAYHKATDISNEWENGIISLDGYVGLGDECDWYKLEVNSLTTFDFDLEADDKEAKITVYKWDSSKGRYKKIKRALEKHSSKTINQPQIMNYDQIPYSQYMPATIDNLTLDAGLYYVEVLSADKGKGKKNTEYELDITAV